MSIDTVNDLPPRVQYVASAGQTVFPYPFPAFVAADLVVEVNGAIQALNTVYTVDGVDIDPNDDEGSSETGGNVTFVDPLVGGEIVTIYRELAIERDTDIQQNGPWRSQAYNDEQDKTYLILQQIAASVRRSLRIPIDAAVNDADIELVVANYANKYLTFNAVGKPTPAVLASSTMTQAIIGALENPQTPAELAASITPSYYNFLPGNVLRYGALGNGAGDDTVAIQKAFNTGHNVHFPAGYSFKMLGSVTSTNSNLLVTAHGAEIVGDSANSANPMFNFTNGAGVITNVHWRGGLIKSGGALGWVRIRNAHDCDFEDFKCEGTAVLANSFGVHIVNCFNIYVQNFNIHGSQGVGGAGNPGFKSGVRIETDAGAGFTVINNIRVADGIAQRSSKNVDLIFASASSGVTLDNLALLDTNGAPFGTNGIYLSGILDHLQILNCKSEYLPTVIAVDNAGGNRSNITIMDFRFTMNAGQYCMNIDGASTIVHLLGKIDATATAASGNWFNTMTGKVICYGQLVEISNMTAWDGTAGIFLNYEPFVTAKTTATTIKRIQEGQVWTNSGATASVTFTLPAASVQQNFRASFRVMDTDGIRIDPNGTDQIKGLTDAGGDRIESAVIGETITLVSDGATNWYVDKVYGTWADIN